jgi:hypothetical protein
MMCFAASPSLVLILEDGTRIDQTSGHSCPFLSRPGGSAIFLLCTYRPGYRRPGSTSRLTQLAINRSPLLKPEHRPRQVADVRSADPLARRILEKAEAIHSFEELPGRRRASWHSRHCADT